jgi:hypothetical protein
MSLTVKMVFILCLFFCVEVEAQTFGGVPHSLHWKQINTDTARIIFPVGLDSEAQQVAAIVHALSRNTLYTVGPQQRKINIVFQNQITISNGYVQLAPFLSEFELTADQNSFELGSLPWQQQLAIHEYRHVQQYNNYRVGLSKVFYYLFGEGGQELANDLSLPNWFWEGDAVYQETLVSKQGRGRLPYFFNGYRALWAGGKDYSWMKLRNGSLRDYTPDWYPPGYMLVAYGREQFGHEFWKQVALDAASFKGVFYPLQKGIEKYSGMTFTQFRAKAFDHFKEQIKSDSVDLIGQYGAAHRHFVADEEFPQFVDSDHIIYMRSTYKVPPCFVVDDLRLSTEQKVATRSISLDNYFSYRKDKVVYAAYQPDIRWGWRTYSVLRVLDLKTGEEHQITTHSKYFAPDISADANHIVAVLQSPSGRSQLHILNSQTGAIEKIIPQTQDLFYTYPKFYGDHQVVSAVRNQKGEMALALFNINDGIPIYLTLFSMNVIGFPSVQNDTIYFSASYQGHDRLFAAVSGRLFKVQVPIFNPATGDYELQGAGGQYAWNSFSAVGFKMNRAKESNIQFLPIAADELTGPLLTQGMDSLNQGPSDLLDKISFGNYPVSTYSTASKLFNFYGWQPYINDPIFMFSFLSENVLSTLQTQLFVGYNRNEQYKQVGINAIYGGFFPWLDAGYNYTFDRNAFYGTQKVYWNEMQGNLGFSVPLNLSKGKTNTTLQFGSDIVYNQRFFRGAYKDTFNSKGFAYIDPFISFTHQTQQAQMQIYPSFAQTLTVNYETAVTTFEAQQLLVSGYFYFPGLTRTNSLVLAAAFQGRDSLNNFSYSNNFPFSRGYSAENFYRMYRLSANYNFPLLYPDWGVGNAVYFLRVRANLFFDNTQVFDFTATGNKFNAVYNSCGTEIYFDTKWWNELSISFGFRYARLLDPDFQGRGPNQFEFILPINLLSL